MCVLSKLTSTPCGENAAGLKQIGYAVPVSEITADPDWKVGSAEGDYVTADGDIDFSGAATGKGYWRSFPMLINKGSYSRTAVGAVGSKQFKETFTFFISGFDAAQTEFVTRILNIPSAWLCLDQNGEVHMLGRKDNAAYVEAIEGTTGEGAEGERGYNVTITAYTPRPMHYTGAIDITANT